MTWLWFVLAFVGGGLLAVWLLYTIFSRGFWKN